MKKNKKYLTFCNHGLVVVYPVPEYTSGLPMTSCGHVESMFGKEATIEDIIEWIESVKQPRWYKVISIGKWQLSLVKYWK